MVKKIKDKKVRNNKGITLIALVITIIVLLILAGISIATLTGENGILRQAGTAKEETSKAAAKEKVELEVAGSFNAKTGLFDKEIFKQNLKDNLKLTDKDIKENADGTITVTIDGYEVIVDSKGKVTIGEATPPNPPVSEVTPGEKVEGSNKIYSDGKDTAMIPEDFTVSDKAGESTISTGLVVIGPDGSEFVWVPVEDINSMSQCSTAGGDCNLQLQNEHLKCTTHNSEEIVGKLYATSTGENFGTVNTVYNPNDGSREPAVVTGNSSGTGTVYDADTTNKYYEKAGYSSTSTMLEGLKNEYKLMAESVAKYGGFYVGRYEMSLSSATETEAGTSGTVQSKAGVLPTSAKNSATNMWYGLYDKAKTYEVSSVQSSMIWGSQYDAMMNWVKNSGTSDASKITTKGIGNNSSGSVTTAGNGSYSNDSINHVRDLGGNLREWTLEAINTGSRVYRGGYYSSNYSPSYGYSYSPSTTYAYYGSRLTLHIQ